jgi:hypothetical protein
MDPCPCEVKTRAEILNCAGFSGFQAPDGGGKDCFVVCLFSDDSLIANLNDIKKETQCASLCDDVWVGRDYLHVHWRDHSRIPIILNTLLKRGHSFQAATKGLPFFDAKEGGDIVFSQIALDRKAMAHAKEFLDMRMFDMINDAYCEEWNYVSEEGKAFARELKANPLMCHRYGSCRTNFYEWKLFESYDKATLCSL